MIDYMGDDDHLHRGWTPGRVIGWLLVVLGVGLEWFTWSSSHITYGMEIGSGLWWSGGWILLWSWLLWRRRLRRHESAEIQAQAMARWSRR